MNKVLQEKKSCHVLLILLVAFISLVMTQKVIALDYPTRPITMIIPFSPGGASEASRLIVERYSEFLGQPVVVDYKAGASGSIGAAYVAKAKPDGYTLLLASQTPNIVQPLVKPGLSYKIDDLIVICGFARSFIRISTQPDAPWKTLPEFIMEAKKNPGQKKYASYGALSIAHFAMELLSKRAGISMTHIPYDGTGTANMAALGGHVDVACTTSSGGLYEAGTLKILAMAAEERLRWMKDVPTLTELGYPITLGAFNALSGPKGIPKEIVDKLNEANKKAFAKYGKEIEAGHQKFEMQPLCPGPKEISQIYQEEKKIYYEIAKELGVLAQP